MTYKPWNGEPCSFCGKPGDEQFFDGGMIACSDNRWACSTGCKVAIDGQQWCRPGLLEEIARMDLVQQTRLIEWIRATVSKDWVDSLRLKDHFHDDACEYMVTALPDAKRPISFRVASSDGNLFDLGKKWVRENCKAGRLNVEAVKR